MSANSRFTVAVHALLVLDAFPDEPVRSQFVAGSVNTNPVVIRRVLGTLVDGGLVEATKGAHGGYTLARAADTVTLWDIYRLMQDEGAFRLHPSEPNPKCPVGHNIQRVLGEVYQQLDEATELVLRRYTLADLRHRLAQSPC